MCFNAVWFYFAFSESEVREIQLERPITPINVSAVC